MGILTDGSGLTEPQKGDVIIDFSFIDRVNVAVALHFLAALLLLLIH